jgi:thioredoxin:protein disulfide reductase
MNTMIQRYSRLAFSAAGKLSGASRGGLRGPLPLLVLVAVAFSLSSDARARQSSSGASVVLPKAYVSLLPVPRGRIFEIAVVGKIAHGFHVNAHVPSEDYLIPTRIAADLPSGILLVETTYPRGVMRKFGFADKPLRVYENSFTVRMKLRAASNAPIGPQKIGLTLGYQACTEDACLPPVKVSATAELELAPEDTPAAPANRDVFSGGPPS